MNTIFEFVAGLMFYALPIGGAVFVLNFFGLV